MWKNASLNNELHLPERNDFIPTNFDIYPLEDDVSYTVTKFFPD